jgi:hypothetical protein
VSSTYETDVFRWSTEQAALLRRLAAGEQVNAAIDWPNVIDEVETVGRSERAALRSHLVVIIEHLLKLAASPASEPRRGWMDSINRARDEVQIVLQESPSLRPAVNDLIAEGASRAARRVKQALALFDETPRVAIDSLSFTEDQILGDWFPT